MLNTVKISALPGASSLTGPELFEMVQGGANTKVTAFQLLTYLITGQGGAAAITGFGVMLSLFGLITALSSGAGTLSGIATAGLATPRNTAVWFSVGGVPQGWVLQPGTNTTGSGIQLPDDYDPSTNACFWQQFA